MFVFIPPTRVNVKLCFSTRLEIKPGKKSSHCCFTIRIYQEINRPSSEIENRSDVYNID